VDADGAAWRVLSTVASLAERMGERCGGPVILAGLVLGLGVVQLVTGPLGQSSRFSLELLILLVLQLVGPMLVALLALALLLPRWLERVQRLGTTAWRDSVPAAAVVGVLLMLLFFAAALCGGVLASPRGDLVGETLDLLKGLRWLDLSRACLRAGVFLALVCVWSQGRLALGLRRERDPGLLVSDQLAEGLVLLLLLKLLWITVVDPLNLTASPS
jgi:tetrahydromethanopterin S-methyltransferase subunit G